MFKQKCNKSDVDIQILHIHSLYVVFFLLGVTISLSALLSNFICYLRLFLTMTFITINYNDMSFKNVKYTRNLLNLKKAHFVESYSNNLSLAQTFNS